MTRTRTRAGTSQGGNDGDLPPPPSPSANEFFAQFLGNQRAMEETLRLIAQNQGSETNQYSIEQKFHLLRVTEMMKAEYASHQLQGPTCI